MPDLTIRHHRENFGGISLSQDPGFSKPQLLRRALGREHVPRVRMLELDLATLGDLEAFGGGSAGPDFRHVR